MISRTLFQSESCGEASVRPTPDGHPEMCVIKLLIKLLFLKNNDDNPRMALATLNVSFNSIFNAYFMSLNQSSNQVKMILLSLLKDCLTCLDPSKRPLQPVACSEMFKIIRNIQHSTLSEKKNKMYTCLKMINIIRQKLPKLHISRCSKLLEIEN